MLPVWLLGVLLIGYSLFQTVTTAGSEEAQGSPFVNSSVREAIRLVNRADRKTRDRDSVKQKLLRRSASFKELMVLFNQPTAETRTGIRSAENMQAALNLIQRRAHHVHKRSLNISDVQSNNDLSHILQTSGCSPLTKLPVCTEETEFYRTINGQCNNRNNPLLGAAFTPLKRWLAPEYEDGITIPRGSKKGLLYSGFPLPLVRHVSNKIRNFLNYETPLDFKYSQFLMQWGQWIDHDLSLTLMSGKGDVDCGTSCSKEAPCFPIEIPQDDHRIMDPNGCLSFFRSAPACVTRQSAKRFGNLHTREQLNGITAFIDGSMVYGSTKAQANLLRDQTSNLGRLRVNEAFTDNGLEHLPFMNVSMNPCAQSRCQTVDDDHPDIPCFIAGDKRANEHIRVTVLHTIFVREHNRLARELKKLNPHWSGERIYQEARKIIAAIHQIITYRDYLPKIIGPRAMRKYLPKYRSYNSSIDPSIKNAFATAAFRFGHGTIHAIVPRLNESYKEHHKFPNLLLRNSFFTPGKLIYQGGIDPFLRGLIRYPNKLMKQDIVLVNDLYDHLFENVSQVADDLASLNMQRGRDHGLPGYNSWRRFCGLSAPKNEEEFSKVLKNPTVANNLIKLYGTPENIDLWLAGIIEPFVKRGRVGQLFACLIGKQFQELRDGDRFWHEQKNIFSKEQHQTLLRVSLARIICDNSKIEFLPIDVFVLNPFLNCRWIPKINLNFWKDVM
ncbi:myeloperoxidase-like isoform X1 [Hemiscyllium ocellatum]|uniref:myeloperoxidase-like isoform X1 n=2 Tax=Hemiscyllium ocellatum TaxID=170820 RepID=UPI002967393D|nr:myeloperoxidase-like isoform X1 [Hemiscyllium ocellatum]